MSEGLHHSDSNRLDATLPDSMASEFEGGLLARGTSVGRYLVLEHLGAGSMGVVQAAYDPELDRKVALKLLRADRYGAHGRSRLLREAQALARLSHPNVVAIYDVGTHDNQVWIAMEFVEGQTFGAYLALAPRSWREVLARMLQAGRGLAAAHAKGLVHRDFKPENVMIDNEGRVRVMDFGLARTPLNESEASGPLLEPSIEALIDGTFLNPNDSDLTAAGALMGTPRYMAAELWTGGIADARSDQFSFCLMLWESIYGQRAFAGESLGELSAAIQTGQLSEVSRRSDVPAWLRRVIERGLSVDPQQRWPGMPELLAALTDGRGRKRGGVLALVGLLGLAGAGYTALELRTARELETCAVEGQALHETVWTPATRTTVGEALLGTGLAYAAEVRPRVLARIDAYAEEWAQARTQLCREAKIDETLNAEMLELAVECLDEGRYTLGELVVILGAEPDRELLSRSISSVASLPRLARCQDRAWLARRERPPADSDTRESVRTLRRRLDRAAAMVVTFKFDAAGAEAEAVLVEAEALGWLPLVAEAHLLSGTVLAGLGQHEAAVPMLEQALYEATSAGHDEIAAAAAEALVFRVGVSLARHEEGLRYAKLAEAFLARAGLEGKFTNAKYHVDLGTLYQRKGDFDGALAAYARGREIFEEVLGADHPELARIHANVGVVYYMQGAYPEALGSYARAEELQRENFGSQYPGLARTWSNIGVVHLVEGRYEQALHYYERALAVMEASLDPGHVDLAVLLNNVGMVHAEVGEDAEALSYYERALAIRERALGLDHPDVADSLNNLAQVRGNLGAPPDEIEAMHERARSILEIKLGVDHPRYAGSLINLGLLAFETGEIERANELYERASEIVKASVGDKHPQMGDIFINHGDVAVARGELELARTRYQEALTIYVAVYGSEDHPAAAEGLRGLALVHELEGRPAEARELLERALKINETAGARPRVLGLSRFALARVLWELGERTRAHEFATQARSDYASARRLRERDAVDTWLAAHTDESL